MHGVTPDIAPAPHQPLTPARLIYDADGTPRAVDFDDVYHSADGGPGQAMHVFLRGNGLPERWRGRERFVILENGFGTGLNFLATWMAWREDPERPARLHYLATEAHPLGDADFASLRARWPDHAALAEALRAAWPPPLAGFHRLEFAGGRVVLTLMFGDARATLSQLDARVDAFYLDGFDPRKNPEMWSPELFMHCASVAAPDATLATWCVAGAVREGLNRAGFAVDKRPGYGRKRQMLVGRRIASNRPPTGSAPPRARHALVLGAGVAGCAISERLVRRGWQVTLLERHAAPAMAASGNRAGIVRPLLARVETPAARLSRTSFLYATRAWRLLDPLGAPPRRALTGVLQLARDDAREVALRELLERAAYPVDYARYLNREQASARLGWRVPFGGCWFAGGGWASPPDLCRAWLAAAGAGVQARYGVEVAHLQRQGGDWQALDGQGRELGRAPVLVHATGADAARLAPPGVLRLGRTRGQVSHLPAGALPVAMRHAVCGDGYLTPAVRGVHCLGASYAHDDAHAERVDEHADNLRHLRVLMPDAAGAFDAAGLTGRVGFRATTPDRLPLVGALPGGASDAAAGAYTLLGLGSRGLVWAALAAEYLASRICSEPSPLEADLARALDPARSRA